MSHGHLGALDGLTNRLMTENFSRVQPIWVEQHLRSLSAIRTAVGNDLDKVIILAVIGQCMLAALTDVPHDHSRARRVSPSVNRVRLTNTQSIGDATGIPHESVRRKVSELVKAGWVARGRDRRLEILPVAADQLASVSFADFAMLDKVFTFFAEEMMRAGWISVQRLPAAD